MSSARRRPQDCGARLQAIADAGFQYVLNYTAWYGSAEQVRQYADEAQAAGIKLIWPLNDHAWRDGTDLRSYYRYLGPDCPCSSNAQFKQWALGLVKDHPATWGFYVGDELSPTSQNISQTKSLANEVKSIAPNKPTLYVTIPNDNGVLTSQLEPFEQTADYVGADYYPVGKGNNLDALSGYAEDTRRLASQYGKRPVFVLQAFSWSEYDPSYADRFPSRAEMQTMRDTAISDGDPQMMLWYAFNDVMDSSNPAANWEEREGGRLRPLRPRHRRLRQALHPAPEGEGLGAGERGDPQGPRQARRALGAEDPARELTAARGCVSAAAATSSASPRPTARARPRSSR